MVGLFLFVRSFFLCKRKNEQTYSAGELSRFRGYQRSISVGILHLHTLSLIYIIYILLVSLLLIAVLCHGDIVFF